jgi:HKD family nuclease
MKLISSGTDLENTIVKLIDVHDHVSIAVAWASSGTMAYKSLKKSRKKIRQVVIGTHFYQTHPDVLMDFIECNEVRFMLQPQGIFHPKVFLFWSSFSWDILIGSANLTASAMSKNSELMMHFSSIETPQNIKKDIQNQIAEYWEQAEVISSDKAQIYRALWQTQQHALRKVSGEYSNNKQISKAPIQTDIMSMSWANYCMNVQEDSFHGFDERCDLLELVSKAFRNRDPYNEMKLGLRKTVAGLPNTFNPHWGWFGSMKGAGYFHQAVNDNNPHLSNALDLIPFEGLISREYYMLYIDEFKRAFPLGGDGVAVASRLLALKRPDSFVCLDSKNRSRLCQDFGIKESGMNYLRYWDEVICRVMDSIWWNSPKPIEEKQFRIWHGRAALLDALFYQP